MVRVFCDQSDHEVHVFVNVRLFRRAVSNEFSVLFATFRVHSQNLFSERIDFVIFGAKNFVISRVNQLESKHYNAPRPTKSEVFLLKLFKRQKDQDVD